MTDDPLSHADDAGRSTGSDRRRRDHRSRRRVAAAAVAAVALVAAAAAGGWWFGNRSATPAATGSPGGFGAGPVERVVSVTRGPMVQTVSAQGVVAAESTDDLSFTSPGTVTAVNVKAGDAVTAGQVLATIDSASLRSSVAQAQSTVASAKAKLADDQAADASTEQVAADQASLTAGEDQLVAAVHALAGASLVATIDGTVSQVALVVGEQLGGTGTSGTTQTGTATGSGQPVATVGSTGGGTSGQGGSAASSGQGTQSVSSAVASQITVVSTGSYAVNLGVAGVDISKVHDGQSVKLTVTSAANAVGQRGGFGGGFGGGGFGGGGFGGGGTRTTQRATTAANAATATGTVTDVGRVATATNGVASYPVTVAFHADSTQFFVGTDVIAAISTVSRPDVLQVASRAVSTVDGHSQVTVAVGGTVDGATEIHDVTTGQTVDGSTEILSGLSAGDQVLITPPSFGGGGGGPGFATGGRGPTGAGS